VLAHPAAPTTMLRRARSSSSATEVDGRLTHSHNEKCFISRQHCSLKAHTHTSRCVPQDCPRYRHKHTANCYVAVLKCRKST
jgi:hypothetical protein